MKSILLGLLVSSSVFAAESSNLTLITKGSYKVAVQAPHCPVGAMCGPTVRVYIALPLKGCLDTAVMSYKIERSNTSSKTKIIVSALNVANPASKTARCVVAPVAEKQITLGAGVMTQDSVQIEFLQNLAD